MNRVGVLRVQPEAQDVGEGVPTDEHDEKERHEAAAVRLERRLTVEGQTYRSAEVVQLS